MTEYAAGGLVQGPTKDSDLIHVWLDDREQVIFPDGTIRCVYTRRAESESRDG